MQALHTEATGRLDVDGMCEILGIWEELGYTSPRHEEAKGENGGRTYTLRSEIELIGDVSSTLLVDGAEKAGSRLTIRVVNCLDPTSRHLLLVVMVLQDVLADPNVTCIQGRDVETCYTVRKALKDTTQHSRKCNWTKKRIVGKLGTAAGCCVVTRWWIRGRSQCHPSVSPRSRSCGPSTGIVTVWVLSFRICNGSDEVVWDILTILLERSKQGTAERGLGGVEESGIARDGPGIADPVRLASLSLLDVPVRRLSTTTSEPHNTYKYKGKQQRIRRGKRLQREHGSREVVVAVKTNSLKTDVHYRHHTS
ncbi:hypothetical protein BD410DRAFT_809331 [Rickenella mellea]|uniref:Uncharacterized protein n=1 Tax=Rickenella mellea TaxID=50990 RepID=A0A4Y7PHT9_9AGAM|nr:hypothetical protein BD410DRAFT_809331 [Rickenella mellea]